MITVKRSLKYELIRDNKFNTDWIIYIKDITKDNSYNNLIINELRQNYNILYFDYFIGTIDENYRLKDSFFEMSYIINKYRIKNFTLIGFGFGGFIAFEFLKKYYTDIKKIIIFNNPIFIPKELKYALYNSKNFMEFKQNYRDKDLQILYEKLLINSYNPKIAFLYLKSLAFFNISNKTKIHIPIIIINDLDNPYVKYYNEKENSKHFYKYKQIKKKGYCNYTNNRFLQKILNTNL